MNPQRLQGFAYGTFLALAIGWVLHIGKDVLVPIVFSVLVVYVIVGLAEQLVRLPGIGRSARLRYALSILAIALALAWVAALLAAYASRVVALAPQFQASLLATIQASAERLGLEAMPTWGSLRQDVFGQLNLQRLLGSTVTSVTSILATLVVVFLYVTFLLLERRAYDSKVGNLSQDPRTVERVHAIVGAINAKIGSYLALKTLISVLLGVVSWAVMAWAGLEFAAFWAVLIALLNYIPYLGSFLGVFFPVVFALMQFGDYGAVMTVLVPLALAQMVIGNFLDPWMMSNSLNLSPFVILASLATWSALWGIPGAFLAVPITAVIAMVCAGFAPTRPIAVLLSRNGEV
ncbi:MAG TPA: AI-2E family transporter [Pseudomonadota bacterium]|nr:AI-2E family transporter [Xanthomonadales bacterium]HQW63374.1 AI-2E family transporter [Pseudomonadota bacterium]MBP6691879.1 AI-2E family transporter [Xanthomonadales bacterium]MBP7417676.1 AI-2E family transporter [Xanthomonadales bacterium]MBP8176255.1 AI-2E family transporter [Xanthomonadales bacterium]